MPFVVPDSVQASAPMFLRVCNLLVDKYLRTEKKKNSLKIKFLGRPGTFGAHKSGYIPEPGFGTSRTKTLCKGRLGSEKLYARRLWADFSITILPRSIPSELIGNLSLGLWKDRTTDCRAEILWALLWLIWTG